MKILTWTTVKGLHLRGTSWEPPRTTTPNVPLSFSNVTWSSDIIVIMVMMIIMMMIVMATWITFVRALGLGPVGGRRYFTSSCTLSVVSSFWSTMIYIVLLMIMMAKDKMVLIMFMMADLNNLMLSQVWAIYIVQAEEKVANTEHIAEDDEFWQFPLKHQSVTFTFTSVEPKNQEQGPPPLAWARCLCLQLLSPDEKQNTKNFDEILLRQHGVFAPSYYHLIRKNIFKILVRYYRDKILLILEFLP